MIREYTEEDKEKIDDIVKQGIIVDEESIHFLKDHSDKIIVFEHGQREILGFSTFRIWGKDKNKADVYTYVVPNSRNKGI